MTQKAALAKSLLKGEVLSIMNCFKWFGVTNCPREIGRSIERYFGVEVSRVKKEFISKYGQPGFYYEYRLNHTDQNLEGISKMQSYVSEMENKPFYAPLKRGPKKIHVKKDNLKQAPLEFNISTGSWDDAIN